MTHPTAHSAHRSYKALQGLETPIHNYSWVDFRAVINLHSAIPSASQAVVVELH